MIGKGDQMFTDIHLRYKLLIQLILLFKLFQDILTYFELFKG